MSPIRRFSWRLAVDGWRQKPQHPQADASLPSTANRQPPTASRQPPTEQGFTLAALIVILTIMSIVIAYTVPEQWSMVMKRERERQTIFMMKQFARGILNFRAKHNGTNPTSFDQLVDAREPRLVRGGAKGEWICPLTGKEDDWILVPRGAVAPGGGLPGVPPGGGGGGGGIIGSPSSKTPAPPSTGGGGPGRLNPEASPEDYVGEFIAVRPKAKGKAYITLNGAENYEEWVYTADDLYNEIQMRLMGAGTP